MKIAILTTDNREHYKAYSSKTPFFGTAPQALLDGLAKIDDVEVHVVSCLQKRVTSPKMLADNIWYHGLHIPKLGWLRTGYQGCIRAVCRSLRSIQPDIVHGQGTERDCAISAVFSGFPNVLTIHGNMRQIARLFPPKRFSALWFTARLEAFVLPRTGGVICSTSHTQREVEGLARRTWLVPNAVDWSFHKARKLGSTPKKILCVASIYPLKNQIALIEALEPLAQDRPFDLHFFGTVSEQTDYGAEFFRKVKQHTWCHYGGMLSRDALRAQFSDADILVLPALEDNCPMVILEAMTAGVAVVASRVGGIPDLIDDERTGLLIQPENPESIRNAVWRILEDDTLAERLRASALTEAERRFQPRAVAERHQEIYREVITGDL